MTGSYMGAGHQWYALAEELQERMTNLKGIDVSRLNRNQVDVERRIGRNRNVLVEVESFIGRDLIGVGDSVIVKERVTGKTVDLGVNTPWRSHEILEASNQFQGYVDEKGAFELPPQMQTI